jgi:hypothetical protein
LPFQWSLSREPPVRFSFIPACIAGTPPSVFRNCPGGSL